MTLRLAVLTTGRQDWGILRSTCRLLRTDARFALRLLVGGLHCLPGLGATEALVAADGFPDYERLRWLPTDRPVPLFEQASLATAAVGTALQQQPADALMLVGDRTETAAAALAATLTCTPIVHLHGGEATAGALDDALRHAITKLSHLHLVSHPDHAARVLAMGEAAATIHVVGAPGLDNLHRTDLPDRGELEQTLGLSLAPPVVLVTVHPATLAEDPLADVIAVCAAMDHVDATYVITLPNADTGHETLRQALQTAAANHPRRIAVDALGERRYWGLMRLADAVLGNSSSALIEAPALNLPAVNVGGRQQGRLRGPSVLDVPAAAGAVTAGLRQVLAPGFRQGLPADSSPYGQGDCAGRIRDVLVAWQPPHPPVKAVWRAS